MTQTRKYLQSILGSIFLILIGVSTICAQSLQRSFVGFKSVKNGVDIKVSDGHYELRFLSEHILQNEFFQENDTKIYPSHIEKSKPLEVDFELEESEQLLRIKSNGISARIEKKPFQISYWRGDDLLLIEEKGFHNSDIGQEASFKIDTKEVFYGTGARALPMNRRGHRLELYNKAHYGYETHSELLNFTMPLVLSSKKYMLHFDNPQRGWIDLDSKQNNTIKFEVIGGAKRYQVISADTWPQLLGEYTRFSGVQPLPPRWALGNFASRFGYHSQREVEQVIARFEEDQIPLDAIVLDIFWFGKDVKGHMGNLSFDKDSFPSPFKMISDLKEKEIKTVLITEPFVLTTSKRWNEAITEDVLAKDTLGNAYKYDFYFGNTGLIDVFKPQAKDWFWNIYEGFNKKGVAGWWCDLGEPEVHPSDLKHVNGSADEVHNIYGQEWAKMLAEGYQKDRPNQRPFLLMRSGYSGAQKYGMIPWSGDVNRSWEGLQAQPKIALQMGLQGMGYMHSDLGGFAGGERFDAELYTRWLQYGVFQPVFRPHGQEHIPAEPIFHDRKTKQLAKESIALRYRLLPYNYSLAFENSSTGMPLMRPLFFEDINDFSNTYHEGYFWGNDFWIHPVLSPNQKRAAIYFPKGDEWVDFYNGKFYEGGKRIQVPIKEEHIPTYVKSGSIIPMISHLNRTEDYDFSCLELHYFKGIHAKDHKGVLYFDDGITPQAYEKGAYEQLLYRTEHSKDQLKIFLTRRKGADYTLSAVTAQLNLKLNPKRVLLNGNETPFSMNGDQAQINLELKEAIKTTIIEIKYNDES